MKIGVIGLGSIAQKAYLPIYTTEFPQHDWYFSTRREEVLQQTARKYGVPKDRLTTNWKALAEEVGAVFIHTPTHTHEEIIRYYLDKHIPVFVDKPITDDLNTTKELLKLAKENNTLLTTGFNRRFAPMVQKLKALSDKNVLSIEKNQENNTDFSVRYRLYDMMIHPIDTALYLAGETLTVRDSHILTKGEDFLHAWVLLESDTKSVTVRINNQSGAKREVFEVQSPSKTAVVENLTDWIEYTVDGTTQIVAGDWTPTLEKRGFLPMIQTFLKAVETKGENPVSLSSSLASHEVCEAIIDRYEQS
ncbi:Gfo/Idh/MocA family oxidoreductase [Alkalibacterium iburiense]|uniref:Gfo/Idh/MocA family oxidoreductase n=1 Tax=Alkalibacterium iburiense TaxID=290589 RepID=A0ABN0X5T4_9LACT